MKSIHISIINVFPKIGGKLVAKLHHLPAKDDEINRHVMVTKESTDFSNRNMQRLILRIAVSPGRNQREGNRLTVCFCSERERPAIAGGKELVLSPAAAVPAWADSVNHILRGKTVSRCDFSITGFAATERTALLQKLRPCSPVNGSVNTSSTQERCVRRIHNGVHLHFCYIIPYNVKWHRFASVLFHQPPRYAFLTSSDSRSSFPVPLSFILPFSST